jgi:hypothetical protein
MIVVERQIQKIYPDKWAELEKIDKKYDGVEGRLGFPPKKRYRCMFGLHDTDTLIIERQWESLAAMEAAYDKGAADQELQALWAEGTSIVRSTQFELYGPL